MSWWTVFFWSVPFMALALFASIYMQEKPLSDEMMQVAAGELVVIAAYAHAAARGKTRR